MRCKACNNEMTTNEMVVREETGEFEDLCTTCLKASEDEYEVEVEFGLIKAKCNMDGDEWDN